MRRERKQWTKQVVLFICFRLKGQTKESQKMYFSKKMIKTRTIFRAGSRNWRRCLPWMGWTGNGGWTTAVCCFITSFFSSFRSTGGFKRRIRCRPRDCFVRPCGKGGYLLTLERIRYVESFNQTPVILGILAQCQRVFSSLTSVDGTLARP